MKNDKPSEFARYASKLTSLPHSAHLARLTDPQLHALRDHLIDQHDAHRTTKFDSGAATSSELREYLNAVRIEILTRVDATPVTRRKMNKRAARFESRRPTNVLKRAVDSVNSSGSMSLADMQVAYLKVK